MATEITLFEPDLPSTPGWAKLSQTKRDWLQEKTSNIKHTVSAEGLAVIRRCIELIEVEVGLQNEELTFTSYVKTIFHGSESTAWRTLRDFKQLMKLWPMEVVNTLAERGFRGASGTGLKAVVNVAKELPAPKSKEPRTIEAFVEKQVRGRLEERKSANRKGRVIKLSDDDAEYLFFNSGRRLLDSTKSLKTSSDTRAFLKKIVGWWMEYRAIPGTIECKRVSIPEGMIARVGRPRKPPRSNAA